MSIDSIKKITDDLARRYESSSVRILVDLLPGIDNTLMHFRAQRLRVYFEELASGAIDLTEDEIQGEDFLHAFFATVRAASRTRQRKKIRLFARLFANYIERGKFSDSDADDFDETFDILENLSYNEFKILVILRSYETEFLIAEDHKENQESISSRLVFWRGFIKEVADDLGIDTDHVPGMLERLNRTGLYMTIVDDIAITSDTFHYVGYLTPNFFSFMDLLKDEVP